MRWCFGNPHFRTSQPFQPCIMLKSLPGHILATCAFTIDLKGQWPRYWPAGFIVLCALSEQQLAGLGALPKGDRR